MHEFPKLVADRIGYYVYMLLDPTNNQVFYVGKGMGNRVFDHVRHAKENPNDTNKLQRISEITNKGREVKYEILRHGLNENEAIEVEAAIIDLLGLSSLTNTKEGHKSEKRGRMTVPEIIAIYNPEPVEIREPVILVIPNKYYERNIDPDYLYEISRGNWVLGKRRSKAKYSITVVDGVVLQVYRIIRWTEVKARRAEAKTQNRWRFDGEVANEMQHYLGKSVVSYIVSGSRNPVRYINC